MDNQDNPTPQPDQPPTMQSPPEEIEHVPPLEQKSNKWTFLFLGLLLVSLLISTGILAYQNQQLRSELSQLSRSQETPSPLATDKPDGDVLTESFQEHLNRYCAKRQGSDSGYDIKIEDLPVTLASSLDIRTFAGSPSGTVLCSDSVTPNFQESTQSFATIPLNNFNDLIELYDDNSVEGGHGPPPVLGSLSSKIGQKGDIEFTIVPGYPHGGCALIGSVSILARGRKTLNLSNGENIYANVDIEIIDANDPRLIELFNQNSKECEFYETGEREIVSEGIDEKIIQRFFSDFDNLMNSESVKIRQIENILDAITAK